MGRFEKASSPRKYTIPFYIAMGLLCVTSFLLPLRPQVSYLEKRELQKFPEFSAEAFLSGSYLKDISTWFSDTFPGREQWLTLSQQLSGLHGYGDISFQGDRPVPVIPQPEAENLPTAQPPAAAEAVTPEPLTEAAESIPSPTEAAPAETTAPLYTVDEDVLLDLTVNADSVVQMGDTVFYPVGFSDIYSNQYITALNTLADAVADRGTRVISAISPTAVGVIVPEEYLSAIGSSPQTEILDYLKAGLSDRVITVDTVRTLQEHKDEYLFFHTDHHWTATAAYYCYRAACEALGMEPAGLDRFTQMNQGTFKGSMYGKANTPWKLADDYVLTYDPIGNISMTLVQENDFETPAQIIRDMRDQDENMKYIAFLMGDQPLVHIKNDDLPEGSNCLIIKDSFGNCFVPFFSMNYRNVYAIDYRKFHTLLPYLCQHYDIQDVIFAPNIMSVESVTGANIFKTLCGVY